MRPHALLLEAPPGAGKTTALARLAELVAARGRRAAGLLTRELRERGARVGFAIETLGGARATLARADGSGEPRVGRYVVDVAALDRVVAVALRDDAPADVVLVDEIGKMECLSPRFVAAVTRLLDGGRLLAATVAL